MPGGHGGRAFFSGQVSKYADELATNLPDDGYTAEEERAGFPQIMEAFGFYATLDTVARYVGQDDEDVKNWSVIRFFNKLKFIAWRSHAQKEYQKEMAKKQN